MIYISPGRGRGWGCLFHSLAPVRRFAAGGLAAFPVLARARALRWSAPRLSCAWPDGWMEKRGRGQGDMNRSSAVWEVGWMLRTVPCVLTSRMRVLGDLNNTVPDGWMGKRRRVVASSCDPSRRAVTTPVTDARKADSFTLGVHVGLPPLLQLLLL